MSMNLYLHIKRSFPVGEDAPDLVQTPTDLTYRVMALAPEGVHSQAREYFTWLLRDKRMPVDRIYDHMLSVQTFLSQPGAEFAFC